MIESVSVMVLFFHMQYDVSDTSTVSPDSIFYEQPVTSIVYLLSWQEGLNYITVIVATENLVS